MRWFRPLPFRIGSRETVAFSGGNRYLCAIFPKDSETMKRTVYEAPVAEAVAVKTERTILSAKISSSRASYGKANDGLDDSQLDGEGNWAWN